MSQTNGLSVTDLDPGHFENLVRQLAHGFRPWRYLEATGKLGRDKGVDIRAVEVVTLGLPSGAQDEPVPEIRTGVDYIPSPVTEERVWRIQCKRYKEIGPTAMRTFVQEVVPDPSDPPYAIILAAACDVSAETLSAFHEERTSRGVQEGHVWSKAHLGDLLYRPENDHLLFAYFGISLATRRRSLVQDIQAALIIKQKIIRALDIEDILFFVDKDILVRNIEDKRYPRYFEGMESLRLRPWHACRLRVFQPDGVELMVNGFPGWFREDGTWDIAEQYRSSASNPYGHRQHMEDTPANEYGNLAAERDFCKNIPRDEFATIVESLVLPYSSIVDIDPWGDHVFKCPHFYCKFQGDWGPFAPETHQFLYLGHTDLDPEMRRPHFKDLLSNRPTNPSSGGDAP